MSTILKMEIEELNNIKASITKSMEAIETEINTHVTILDRFQSNAYMKGGIEATSMIRDKAVNANRALQVSMNTLLDVLSKATIRVEETEADFEQRFQTLAGDDFIADNIMEGVAPAIASVAAVNLSSHIVSGDTSFKSYMSYQSLTNTSSAQYKLQQDPNTYTDAQGLRRNGDDYLVALGTAFGDEIGTRYKITLSNGQTFTAMLGDVKNPADSMTNSAGQSVGHRHGNSTGVVEFIVDTGALDSTARRAGSIGALDGFDGNVVSIEKIGKYGDFQWGQ